MYVSKASFGVNKLRVASVAHESKLSLNLKINITIACVNTIKEYNQPMRGRIPLALYQ